MKTNSAITDYSATPAKLQSGEWGARVQSGAVKPGDTLTIHTKAGKSWRATVAKVVWHDDSVSLVATSSDGGSASGNGADAEASAAQLTAIGRMLQRLRRVRMFDSVSRNGAEMAAEYEDKMSEGLTRRQASAMIEDIGCLLDDEM